MGQVRGAEKASLISGCEWTGARNNTAIMFGSNTKLAEGLRHDWERYLEYIGVTGIHILRLGNLYKHGENRVKP